MTREEILKEFKVNEHGIIRSPGKFEGEMLYAPYFYDRMLDGDGEEVYEEPSEDMTEEDALNSAPDMLLYTELEVTGEDRAEFPELDPATKAVRVSQTSQGFIYVEEV